MDILLSCRPIPAIEALEIGPHRPRRARGHRARRRTRGRRPGRRERAAVDPGDPAGVARDRAHDATPRRCSTRTRSAGRCSRPRTPRKAREAFAEKRPPSTRAGDGSREAAPDTRRHRSSRPERGRLAEAVATPRRRDAHRRGRGYRDARRAPPRWSKRLATRALGRGDWATPRACVPVPRNRHDDYLPRRRSSAK